MNRPCPTRLSFSLAALVLLAGSAAADIPEGAEARRERRRSPVVEVFERCRDAVVNISTTRIVRLRTRGFRSPFETFLFGPRRTDRRVHSVGSGIVVHPSGYIVTNAHVVSQASDVQIIFADEHVEPADIIAVDAEHDLAVLKIETERPLEWLSLGRSDDIMIGETVVAIGNPLGLQHTVTAGIVSALDRELPLGEDRTYRGLIQTDAPINPGNSGGPLLNVNAELIGINVAIRGDAQNIGFAIPVDRLWKLLPAMLDIERRERVRFGLRVSGPRAQVLTVQPGTPAAQAGLQPADQVVAFNGQEIHDAIDYYVHLLEQPPGNEVRLTLKRDGDVIRKSVPLEIIPLPDGQDLAQRLLGVTLEPIPARLRQRYELPRYIGVVVTNVEPASPAARAGIEPGDLILRIDRGSTDTLKEVGLALEKVTPGERIAIEGLRLHSDPAFFWGPISIPTRD